MKHQIYTVIFVKCINRNSKLQNHILVACDECGELTSTYDGASNNSTLMILFTSIQYKIRSYLLGLSNILKLANWLLISHRQDIIIGGIGLVAIPGK